mgnify:CR=1 FL=1
MANILIGISGSIAAYKIIELTHKLKQDNHQVKIILTKDATMFITTQALTAFGAQVYGDDNNSLVMEHIDLARWPDMVIIAPLSANTMAKLANGLADNLLTTTVLASRCPIYLAPAMNMHMWQNPITQNNIDKLKSYGFTFWGPDKGLQACGDNGEGRMLEPSEILANINHSILAHNKLFTGKNIVITAGATLEPIDSVRYLSNHSSGKMGYALARAFASNGAQVTLISAPTDLVRPNNITQMVDVTTTEDMLQRCLQASATADIFISCAAVSDYKIANYSTQKIKKSTATLNLELVQTPDIITQVKSRYPSLFVIGFAAETNDVIEYAKQKLVKKNLDMIIANDVSNGKIFNQPDTNIVIIDKTLAIIENFAGTKDAAAHKIVNIVHQQLQHL